MPQIVDLPDGSVAEFPDGMSREDILGVIRKRRKPSVPTAAGKLNAQESFIPDDVAAADEAFQTAEEKRTKPWRYPTIPNPSQAAVMSQPIGTGGFNPISEPTLPGQASKRDRIRAQIDQAASEAAKQEMLADAYKVAEIGARAFDFGKPLEAASQPLITLPRIPESKDRGTAAQIAAGVANAGIGAAEFFASPLGVATLGQGALPAAAQKLIASGFSAQMASHLPELASQAKEQALLGSPQKAAEAIANLGITGAFAAHAPVSEALRVRGENAAARSAEGKRPIDIWNNEAIPPRKAEDIVTATPRTAESEQAAQAPSEPAPVAPEKPIEESPMWQLEQDQAAYEKALSEVQQVKKADPEIAKIEEAIGRGPEKGLSENASQSDLISDMSESGRKAFSQVKSAKDEFVGVDVTDLPVSDRRNLARLGIQLSENRNNRIVATYPSRLRVEDLRNAVKEKRSKKIEEAIKKESVPIEDADAIEAAIEKQQQPKIEEPANIDDLIQILQDSIDTKKRNSQTVPQKWINRLAELQSKKRGENPEIGKIASDESTPGHPFNSENPVLPLYVEPTKAGLSTLKSSWDYAQKRIENARVKLRNAKGANRDEFEVEIENMKKAQKELSRMSRVVEDLLQKSEPKTTGEPNAIQEQAAGQGVLRAAEPKPEVGVGLPEVGKRNAKPEVAPARAEGEQGGLPGAKEEAVGTPEQIYDKSLSVFKKESADFRKVREAYRAGKVSDADFLNAKSKFEKASKIADAAETTFIESKNKEGVKLQPEDIQGFLFEQPKPSKKSKTTEKPSAAGKEIEKYESSKTHKAAVVDNTQVRPSKENAGKIDNSKTHPSLISEDGSRKKLYHGKGGEFPNAELKINPNSMTTLSGLGPAWFTTNKSQAYRFSVPKGNIMEPDAIAINRPFVIEGDKFSIERERHLRGLNQIVGENGGFTLAGLANTDRYKWTPEQKAKWAEWYPKITEFLKSEGVKKLKTGDKLSKFDWAEIYPLVSEFRKRLDEVSRNNDHPDADPFKKLQRLEKEARITLRANGNERADTMQAGEAIRAALQIEGYNGVVLLNTMSDTKLGEAGEGYNPSDWVIPFKAEQVIQKPDTFTQLLDKGIEATKFDPKNLQEGVTGAPVWMTKAALNGALRVIKVSYEATKDAAKAIQNAIVWLRAQGIKDFNEGEARKFLEENYNPKLVTTERREAKPEFVTSNKNATVNAERLAENLPPLEKAERQGNQQAWDEATARMINDPNYVNDLIKNLSDDVRVADNVENAALLRKRISLRNSLEESLLKWKDAYEKGDLVAAAEEGAKADSRRNELSNLEDLVKRVGSEAGRSLQARQMMAAQDFSLAKMQLEKAEAAGRSLTAEENKQLIDAHQKIADLQKRLAELESKKNEADQQSAENDAIKQVAQEARDSKPSKNPEADRAKIESRIGAKFEKGKTNELTPLVQKLARMFWESGIRDRDEMISALHDVLSGFDKEWTIDQTKRAFSGYGNFKPLTMGEVDVGLRDLRGQVQQVIKLEKIANRLPLEKTGVERRTPSDAERRLIKLVNEAKKKFGVVVTDPAKQLKSALQARKTYYENRISDLKYEIQSKERIVKEKSPSPTDPELDLLKQEYGRLKAEHDSIFGNQEMTDAQRLRIATAAAERSEAEWMKRLEDAKSGRFERETKRKVTSPELEAIRARRELLKEQVQELKDLANPRLTPMQIALQQTKARIYDRILNYYERLQNGDFSKREKRMPVRDAEIDRLTAQLDLAKRDYLKGLEIDRFNKMSIFGKTKRLAGDIWDNARNLMTTGEFSALLRQGKFAFLSHPIRTSKALPDMFKALVGDEVKAREIENKVYTDPQYRDALAAKLAIKDENSVLGKQEETAVGHIIGQNNILDQYKAGRPLNKLGSITVGRLNRAARVFLNKTRMDTWKALTKTLSETGVPTPEESRQIATFVNEMTGHGGLGFAENAAPFLSRIFMAPRFSVSRFQMALGHSMWDGTARTRKAIAQEYARIGIGLAIYYSLLSQYFISRKDDGQKRSIELDPRSTDFGKVRVGNTRIDPLAGVQQATVNLARTATGQTKTAKGKVVPLDEAKKKFGSQDWYDYETRFLRSKLHPVIGTAVNLRSGKDLVGKPVTVGDAALNLVTPLTYGDIYDAIKAQDVDDATAMSILTFLGEGLSTYQPTKSTKPY